MTDDTEDQTAQSPVAAPDAHEDSVDEQRHASRAPAVAEETSLKPVTVSKGASQTDEDNQSDEGHYRAYGKSRVTFTIDQLIDRQANRKPDPLPGLLGDGITILAGPPGSGKSELARSVAIALAAGRPILDIRPLAPMRVLYINNRSTGNDLADIFANVPADQRQNIGGNLRIYGKYVADAHRPVNIQTLVGGDNDPVRFDVAILDDFERLRMTEPIERDTLNMLSGWALQNKVRLLIVHQVAAAKAANPTRLMLGADRLVTIADSLIVMSQADEGMRRVRAFRAGTEFRDDLVDGNWTVVGPAKSLKVSGDKATVERELLKADELLGPGDLKVATGLDINNVNVTLYRLRQDGIAVKESRGRYRHVTRDELRSDVKERKQPEAD